MKDKETKVYTCAECGLNLCGICGDCHNHTCDDYQERPIQCAPSETKENGDDEEEYRLHAAPPETSSWERLAAKLALELFKEKHYRVFSQKIYETIDSVAQSEYKRGWDEAHKGISKMMAEEYKKGVADSCKHLLGEDDK